MDAAALGTLIVIFANQPALAAWQWTEWNMPKGGVVAASGGTAEATTQRGLMIRDVDLVASVV